MSETGTTVTIVGSSNISYPTSFLWIVFGFKVSEEFDTLRMYGAFHFEADAEACLAKVKAVFDETALPGSYCGMSRTSLNEYLDDAYWDSLRKDQK
jgi:hypothetical protein